MSDPRVDLALEQFGFAQVLVVMKPPATAVRSIAARTKTGSSVLGHFLDRMPEAAGGAARSFSARRSMRSTPAARQFPLLGVVMGYVDARGLKSLRKDRKVDSVHHAEGISLIRPIEGQKKARRAKTTWGLRSMKIARLRRQGLTGKGVRVGHLDTGVDGSHPALKRRIAGFLETDYQGIRVPGAKPHDTAAHGTHTAGTICGEKVRGFEIGVAPGAELYSGIVIEWGNVLIRVLEGMEWTLEQKVQVLSMSLGFRGYNAFFVAVTQRLRELGTVPVFAIGNEGAGTSRSPGNYPEALSVGAHDSAGEVATFSSSMRFKRQDDPNKPDVLAPGVDIASAATGGGYQTMSGTSMATPHVAGLAALLLEANPNAAVDEVENAIIESCVPLPDEDPIRFGHGRVDGYKALRALTR